MPHRSKSFFFFLLAVLCFPLLHFGDDEQLKAALKKYEGRWVGEFTLHSAATGYTETFPVEQQYWWKDGELRGVAVSQRDDGLQSSRSRSFVNEGTIVSEVKQASDEERFIGVMHEGGIVWLPSDPQRAEGYQMKDTIEEANGGERVLKTEGFDTYVVQGEVAHVVYRGKLVFSE